MALRQREERNIAISKSTLENDSDDSYSIISSADSDPDEETIKLICASVLIPGRGKPINDGALVYEENKILWVGKASHIPSEYEHLKPKKVPVLMPGLWDCHCHYQGIDVVSGISDESAVYLPGFHALVGAIAVDDLKRTLMAGYTSIRELQGYAGDLRRGVDIGAIVGPNIYSSHSALSITGGHGDDHDANINTVKEAMYYGGAPITVCDGVDECIKTVRLMIRRGAHVIKVCSSGGILSLNDDPEDRQFSDAELTAIVEESGRSGRAVAAHAIGKSGIMAALRAGVHSIEHGMYLDEEAVELMKEKGTYLVATQHIVRTVSTDYLDTLPPKMQRKILEVVGRSKAAYALAVRSGVKIALGTDMLSSDPSSKLSHGNNAKELLYAVEAGMSPLQAIECATANGPETLGGKAPKSGQLKAGYEADFIAVAENPLEDLKSLTEPKNILHVWKGGKDFKNP